MLRTLRGSDAKAVQTTHPPDLERATEVLEEAVCLAAEDPPGPRGEEGGRLDLVVLTGSLQNLIQRGY